MAACRTPHFQAWKNSRSRPAIRCGRREIRSPATDSSPTCWRARQPSTPARTRLESRPRARGTPGRRRGSVEPTSRRPGLPCYRHRRHTCCSCGRCCRQTTHSRPHSHATPTPAPRGRLAVASSSPPGFGSPSVTGPLRSGGSSRTPRLAPSRSTGSSPGLSASRSRLRCPA